MFYYLVLFAAVFMFTAQFAFTKIYGEKVQQKIIQTLVMILMISIIGTIMYWVIGGFRVVFSGTLLFYAGAFALVMIPYYVLGIKVLSIGSVAIYSMFMMLGGMALPFAYGLIFLGEPLTWGKAIGCVVLSLAILAQSLTQQKQESVKTENRGLFILLCIAIFILNGLTGVIAKAYAISEDVPDEIGFTVVSCALTAVFSGILLLFVAFKEKKALSIEIKNAIQPVILLCILAIGVFTHTGNFLHLKAAAHLPASIQFPMVSGGVIVCSAIVSTGVFKEKISKKEWFCVALACISTILFAF